NSLDGSGRLDVETFKREESFTGGRIMIRTRSLTGWVFVALVVLVPSVALAASVSVDKITTLTAGTNGQLEVGFRPQESWLEKPEGGNDHSSLMVRVNPTTFVVSVPSTANSGELNQGTSGLVHCFGQPGGSCEFISLGPLGDDRGFLRINDSTGMIQGVGPNL